MLTKTERIVVKEDENTIVTRVTTPKGKRHYEIYNKKTEKKLKLKSVTTYLNLLSKDALYYWNGKVVAEYLGKKIEDLISGKLIITEKNIPVIIGEAKKEANRIKEEAGVIGSTVHDLIEKKNRGLPYKHIIEKLENDWSDERILNSFNAYLDWEKEWEFESILTEEVVWSEKFFFSGTLDTIGFIIIKGKKYKILIDFKTAKYIYSTNIIQLSAYVKAWENLNKEKIPYAGILRLPKEGGSPEFIIYNKKQLNLAFKKFNCLVKYYNFDKELKTLQKKN